MSGSGGVGHSGIVAEGVRGISRVESGSGKGRVGNGGSLDNDRRGDSGLFSRRVRGDRSRHGLERSIEKASFKGKSNVRRRWVIGNRMDGQRLGGRGSRDSANKRDRKIISEIMLRVEKMCNAGTKREEEEEEERGKKEWNSRRGDIYIPRDGMEKR